MQNKAEYLTITQAAEFLKVSPDTLRRWEQKGIVTPQRTKGGSRRYTLYDLKIAKLNKKKSRLFQIPALIKQNYISSRRDLKIALLTSFLWIFALLIYHFLTPIFLKPTNPAQQILSNQFKEKTNLQIASDTTPNKINIIKVLVIPDNAPMAEKISPPTTGSDLLIHQSDNLPTLKYTNIPDQYYYLNKTTLIKRI